MQLGLQDLSLKTAFGCHTCYVRQEKRDNITLPLWKKFGLSIVFAKNSPAKNFQPPKTLAQSFITLLMQLSNKQTDPTIAFVDYERQSYETQ